MENQIVCVDPQFILFCLWTRRIVTSQLPISEQFLLLDPKQYNFMSNGNVSVTNMDEKQEFKNTLVRCSLLLNPYGKYSTVISRIG